MTQMEDAMKKAAIDKKRYSNTGHADQDSIGCPDKQKALPLLKNGEPNRFYIRMIGPVKASGWSRE